MNEEQWKPHPKYPQVDVSDQGNVSNPITGHSLWWESPLGRNSHYRSVTIPGETNVHMRVHRMVWETFVGEIPKGHDVCHRNGNRRDNRLANLYTATRSENKLLGSNLHRNKTGYRGVSMFKRDNVYTAQATVNYKTIHLGRFATAEDAAKRRDDWIMDNYGDKAHPGALNFPERYFTPSELKEAGWKPVDYRQIDEKPVIGKCEINKRARAKRKTQGEVQ